ncbi:TetR/AcrR family transcriptional regulator [Rathayibacter sp. YIM 133350]|uniref:TetR/AcrR family transcriptional regulator n=1 Tax=Rathayibacter sp. YIM 133350 TaxID=3131992 RepID=UPI00307F0CF8
MSEPKSGAAPRASGARRYSSTLRTEQAAETRRRVISAASELFARQGYAGTTMAQIAQAAQVSPETVQLHGPKAALLQACVEVASLGAEGTTNLLDTDFGAGYRDAESLEDFARHAARVSRGLNERIGGVWRALRVAAATDAQLAERWRQMMDSIQGSLRSTLAIAAERGWLRDDVGEDELVASVAVAIDAESHRLLVEAFGFGPEQYEDWLARRLYEIVTGRRWSDVEETASTART